jgi:hypothetical protein
MSMQDASTILHMRFNSSNLHLGSDCKLFDQIDHVVADLLLIDLPYVIASIPATGGVSMALIRKMSRPQLCAPSCTASERCRARSPET